eukprot:SAG11_NODE_505_length_8888_cov_12.479235_11_plen_101_part_00
MNHDVRRDTTIRLGLTGNGPSNGDLADHIVYCYCDNTGAKLIYIKFSGLVKLRTDAIAITVCDAVSQQLEKLGKLSEARWRDKNSTIRLPRDGEQMLAAE